MASMVVYFLVYLAELFGAKLDVYYPSGEHRYWSTGCRENKHDHCSRQLGYQGLKIPSRCKWCPAGCVCPCHREVKGGRLRSVSGDAP